MTGGVHTATDAIKVVMCGASAAQVVAGVIRSGPERLRAMRVEVESWMAEHEYTSIESMRLHEHPPRPNPNVFSRANYMRILQTWAPE